MDTRLTVLGSDEAKAMFAEIGKQAPFALALTLNGLANGTQQETRREVRERFTLRRPDFVLNTIYRKPGEDVATKSKPEAGVRIDDRRDFLAKFEAGGVKQNTDGHRIAIPVDVRRNKNEIITTANRPKALLAKPRIALVGNIIRQAIGRGRAATTRVLYMLKPSVKIPDRLSMRENAEKVLSNDFDRIAGDAIDRALNTARK